MIDPNFVVLAIYKFVKLDNLRALRDTWRSFFVKHDILGTMILAGEGINGTISGSRNAIDAFYRMLHEDGRFDDAEIKESYAAENPFYRLKVPVKKEIVNLQNGEADPTEVVGTYVEPEKWNDLISAPDVKVIDTRNDFEIDVGTFEGAINPGTESFSDFPQYVSRHLDPKRDKRIAMFCTGGIRCEKATSYLKKRGFEEVYHLRGGILKYLEKVPAEQSKWQGECFVFDNRVALTHGLQKGDYELCHGCGNPVSGQDRLSADYEEGVSCPKRRKMLSAEKLQSNRERQRQVGLARERGEQHIGHKAPE